MRIWTVGGAHHEALKRTPGLCNVRVPMLLKSIAWLWMCVGVWAGRVAMACFELRHLTTSSSHEHMRADRKVKLSMKLCCTYLLR